MARANRSRLAFALLVLAATGCRSPYHSDQGALFGGLTGAGVGALVGNAVGHTGAGAAIGAGVGALSGAAIGNGLDEVEARNRAQIEATIGRQVATGAATVDDVLAMTRAGVDPDLVVTHIRARGMARPIGANELIALQQSGVPKEIIQAMQMSPGPSVQAVTPVAYPAYGPPPVVVQEYVYGPPMWCPPRRCYGPHYSWGVSF